MKKQSRLLLPFAVAVILLTTVSCASEDRVDRLEEDIRAIQTQLSQQVRQQQSTEADVTQKLSVISESMNSADQRLTSLETVASELSMSNNDMELQIAEIESALDDRAIKRIFKQPLTYVVAIAILLIGILMGVWGCRWKTR